MVQRTQQLLHSALLEIIENSDRQPIMECAILVAWDADFYISYTFVFQSGRAIGQVNQIEYLLRSIR